MKFKQSNNFDNSSIWTVSKETLVALAMLVPAKHAIDYFILTPGKKRG